MKLRYAALIATGLSAAPILPASSQGMVGIIDPTITPVKAICNRDSQFHAVAFYNDGQRQEFPNMAICLASFPLRTTYQTDHFGTAGAGLTGGMCIVPENINDSCGVVCERGNVCTAYPIPTPSPR